MHATLLVILPNPLPEDVDACVRSLMDPFSNESNRIEKCDDPECGGHNPNWKWDWWDYGGRWDGFYTSGQRTSPEDGGFNFDPKYRTLENNLGVVREIPPMPDGSPRLSCAILTPDGVWHENPSAFNYQADDASWTEMSLAILESYKDHHFAAVDMHS